MRIEHPIPRGIWVKFTTKTLDQYTGDVHLGQVMSYKDHQYTIGNHQVIYEGIPESNIQKIVDEVVEAQVLGVDPANIKYRIDRKVFVKDLQRLMANGGSAAGRIDTSR